MPRHHTTACRMRGGEGRGDRSSAETAHALRRECGLPQHSRCDLDAICRALSIRVKRIPFSSAHAGTDTLLVPTRGGYVVAFATDAKLSECEKRVRLAHEIGHTLFYERSGPATVPRRDRPITEDEESFCDAFARHLLLPRASLSSSREGRRGIAALAERHGIPLADAAIQTALHRDVPVAVAMWAASGETRGTLNVSFSRHLTALPVAAVLSGGSVERLSSPERVVRPRMVVRVGHRTWRAQLPAADGGARPIFWG